MSYPLYYFAYGSNLNRKRLGGRIGRMIPRDEMRSGKLSGYALNLNKTSRCTKCHAPVAKANITQDESSAVEGIVYEIRNDTEHDALRRCEGYSENYGEYDKSVLIAGNTALNCFVYIAQPGKMADGLPVEQWYLAHVLNGKLFLSAAYLAELTEYFERLEKHDCTD